jgi:hypothetical protein
MVMINVCLFYISGTAESSFSKRPIQRDLFTIVCEKRAAALIPRAAAMQQENHFQAAMSRFGSQFLLRGWSLRPRMMTMAEALISSHFCAESWVVQKGYRIY